MQPAAHIDNTAGRIPCWSPCCAQLIPSDAIIRPSAGASPVHRPWGNQVCTSSLQFINGRTSIGGGANKRYLTCPPLQTSDRDSHGSLCKSNCLQARSAWDCKLSMLGDVASPSPASISREARHVRAQFDDHVDPLCATPLQRIMDGNHPPCHGLWSHKTSNSNVMTEHQHSHTYEGQAQSPDRMQPFGEATAKPESSQCALESKTGGASPKSCKVVQTHNVQKKENYAAFHTNENISLRASQSNDSGTSLQALVELVRDHQEKHNEQCTSLKSYVESKLCAMDEYIKSFSLPEVHRLIHDGAQLHLDISSRLCAVEENIKDTSAPQIRNLIRLESEKLRANFEAKLCGLEEVVNSKTLLEKHESDCQQAMGMKGEIAKALPISEDQPYAVKEDFGHESSSQIYGLIERNRLEQKVAFASLKRTFEARVGSVESNIDRIGAILSDLEDNMSKACKNSWQGSVLGQMEFTFLQSPAVSQKALFNCGIKETPSLFEVVKLPADSSPNTGLDHAEMLDSQASISSVATILSAREMMQRASSIGVARQLGNTQDLSATHFSNTGFGMQHGVVLQEQHANIEARVPPKLWQDIEPPHHPNTENACTLISAK